MRRGPARAAAAAACRLLLFVRAGVSAQDRGRLEGRVVDEATGRPLWGVNVMVKGTWLGAVTDEAGRFAVSAVPAGRCDVEASLMGYEKRTAAGLEIAAGAATEVTLRLKQTLIRRPAEIVTASKRKQAIEDAPVTVDVVGDAEIRSRNAVTLDKVLENTAGMGVTDGQIDLRGSTGFNYAAGSRVLLLVDGHPLINGDTGGINWDAIPIEEVERVEVVKGAGSALYGSNALAGMVNVITRDPSAAPETRVRMTAGFHDTPAYDAWRWTDRFLTYRLFDRGELDLRNPLGFAGLDVSHSRAVGPVGLSVTAGRKGGTGYGQNGWVERWNAGVKMKARTSERGTLNLSAGHTDNDHGEVTQWLSQSRPLEVPPSEAGNSIRYRKSNAAVTYRHILNPSLAYTLKANWYRTHWKNDYQDNRDGARTDKTGAEAQFDALWGRHAATFGAEAAHNRAESDIYGSPETLDLAVYGEDGLRFAERATLTAGLRYDFHRVRGVYSDGQLSPRLGLVFRPDAETSLRASFGRGFRAPSIAEVFADITVSGFHVSPNLDLRRAERAWSAEIGAGRTVDLGRLSPVLDGSHPVLLFDAAVFRSDYRDMIEVGLKPGSQDIQFLNIGSAFTQGFEGRVRASLWAGRLSGQAGYTFVDSRDRGTGRPLRYRSKHRLNAGAEWRTGRLTFGLDARFASRIEETLLYNADERVPVRVLDGRVGLDLGRTDLVIECTNMGNYMYTLRERMLEPIRAFSLTLRTAW
ncbi:MAG: TonB-dependent receptor [bacterium]|nr:TonB-dependent receptor [bacterium]